MRRVLLPLQALLFALLVAPVAVAQPVTLDPRDAERLTACFTKAETKPDEAYEDGMIWRSQGGGVQAGQCIAAALIGQGKVETGAERLFDLAFAVDAGDERQRALLLGKAANAWLLIGKADPARAALNRALELVPGDSDLLIDRARANALLADWKAAQTDLDTVLTANPADVLALKLRAEARLQQGDLTGAEQDVAAALLIDGKDLDTLVLRGRLREERRLAGKS